MSQRLETIGESWWGVTFVVKDLDATREFLESPQIDAPSTMVEDSIRIDREYMFGTEFAFTETVLRGDPRAVA